MYEKALTVFVNISLRNTLI